MTHPRASICLSTFGKPASYLRRVLRSIYDQGVILGSRKLQHCEVIVVDDGNPANEGGGETNEFQRICCAYGTPIYARLNRPPEYRNPSYARNLAAKMASGDVLILQSDDVVHVTPDAIARLCDMPAGTFNIATVLNVDAETGEPKSKPTYEFTGRNNPRPFFFLGAVRREDYYAVGGYDEEFVAPAFDDDWLGDCLINGRGLKPVFRDDVIGHHLDHPRPASLRRMVKPSARLYQEKKSLAAGGWGRFQASGGPWRFERGRPLLVTKRESEGSGDSGGDGGQE
jgi:glycosyltransferase involved in cell wall biosynthesis